MDSFRLSKLMDRVGTTSFNKDQLDLIHKNDKVVNTLESCMMFMILPFIVSLTATNIEIIKGVNPPILVFIIIDILWIIKTTYRLILPSRLRKIEEIKEIDNLDL